MNRLQAELHRLYGATPTEQTLPAAQDESLIDARGQVKALVLELAGPADWVAVARVWNGVQTELALPAPAIAVAGDRRYQLWFALAQPMAAAPARAFGQALARHCLDDKLVERVAVWPGLAGGAMQHAPRVPGLLAPGGPWSAFVAPDLAPMFADEPWLDLPPNPDGQAKLLAGLRGILPTELDAALARLRPALAAAPPPLSPEALATPGQPPSSAIQTDPRRFLLEVMNNEALAMDLRIDAAKALLAHSEPGPTA